MTKDVYYLRVNTGSAAPKLNASAARNLLIPPVLQLHKTAVLQNRNDYVRPVFFATNGQRDSQAFAQANTMQPRLATWVSQNITSNH